jgi:N-acyl-phosphatidylethanolamine-hydrolysing phospholipase D
MELHHADGKAPKESFPQKLRTNINFYMKTIKRCRRSNTVNCVPQAEFRWIGLFEFRIILFMKQRYFTFSVLIFLTVLSGCSSYIQRTVWQSITRIGESIPPPPHMITTPVLQNAKLAVSWVGHSTVLIQVHDKLVITDPLFTNTIGMVVKRFVQAGLDPSLLSKVDFTLVSHMHFDHLSYGSLDMLPKNGALLFPDGLARYVPDFGFQEIDEMKSWDVIEKDSVRITAVPVQHFSGRYGFDRDWMEEAGYTGYVIEYKGIVVFFAGDTGYNPELFKEIGRRFKIDLAIIPIAPSSGSGLGSQVHVGPLGALEIFKDVGAHYMMPIHFGTMLFGSTTNPQGPLDQLRAAAAEEGVFDRIVGLEVGEQRILY